MNQYVNKPFKPPRMVGRSTSSDTLVEKNPKLHRNSKRSLTAPANTNNNVKTKIHSTDLTKRSHTLPVQNSSNGTSVAPSAIFTANYRRVTTKKNKTWDGDGYTSLLSDDKIKFFNEAGTSLGSVQIKGRDLYETVFRVGSNEFQLDYKISDPEELSSVQDICRIKGNSLSKTTDSLSLKRQKIDTTIPDNKSPIQTFIPRVTTKFRPAIKNNYNRTVVSAPIGDKILKSMPAKSALPPLSEKLIGEITYCPVFDPLSIDNPLTMNKSQDSKVDVVVDPILSKFLRPHQREGVKFLYDCVMGLEHKKSDKSEIVNKTDDIKGCLLADEMGLGKTLMTITLIWTLLKQTPYPTLINQRGVPLVGEISKVLIVCPVTLISNWKKEFKMWLSMNRIGVLTLHNRNTPAEDKAQVRNFLKVPKTYQVLIIGYEKLLSVKYELQSHKEKPDIVVCDEGHRLKNKDSKILKALQSLEIEKKIILSGTPIQNDLEEFFTIIDFINPGILGSFSGFKREYINPIVRSRDVNAKHNEMLLEQGLMKSKELIDITKQFILRRTNDLLNQYLPPRTDLIIFCRPTNDQITAFAEILNRGRFNFSNMTFNSSLGLITLFKKICNSTSLIEGDSFYNEKLKTQNNTVKSSSSSGKLKVLLALLQEIKSKTEEKVVVVSNYTQTLDIIENHCSSLGFSIARLDGTTATKNRGDIVNSFNNNPSTFVFLLSAKSGGVGLNLIGASRLVLFDNDWNPSIDLQAMSRIHRDGQKRPCYIYRLVTTGCIDEKILQRQLMKIALSKKFLDDNKKQSSNDDDLFQQEELKDLFTVNTSTLSNTHDLICNCNGEAEDFEAEDDVEEKEEEEEGSKKEKSIELQEHIPTRSSKPTWTSALEMKKYIEEEESEKQGSKSELVRNCLLGYKHIDPQRTEDLIDESISNVFNEMRDCITYAFVKDT